MNVNPTLRKINAAKTLTILNTQNNYAILCNIFKIELLSVNRYEAYLCQKQTNLSLINLMNLVIRSLHSLFLNWFHFRFVGINKAINMSQKEFVICIKM